MSDADRVTTSPVREGEPREGETPTAAPANSPAKKDIWDKLPAMTGLFASVVLGAVGLYFTHVHQQAESQRVDAYQQAESKRLESESLRNSELKKHENRLAEIKIFETFLNHLQPSEQEFRVAVLGIEALDSELGQRVLQYYARHSPGDSPAQKMIEERSIAVLNNWSPEHRVLQEWPRFPAYLTELDNPNLPKDKDKLQTVQERCRRHVDDKAAHAESRRKAAAFSIALPFFISEIRNYHYNGNCGSDGPRTSAIGPSGLTAPTIGLRDTQGRQIGIWRARPYYQESGYPGEEGVKIPVAWFAYPSFMVMPGTYEVTDSDEGTWSFNEDSDFAGFTLVLALDSSR